MPRCSVFGCRTNYDSEIERFNTFSLPKDPEIRRKWVRAIPTDLSKLKNPYVCIKHFHDSDIIRVDKVMYKGELKEYPRERPKLSFNAVPAKFENTPRDLSKPEVKTKRLVDVEQARFEETVRNGISDHARYMERTKIVTLSCISTSLKKNNDFLKKQTYMQNAPNQHSNLKNIEIPDWRLSTDFEKKLNTVSVKSKTPKIESCCVKNCKSHQKTRTNMAFHKFPLKNKVLTRKWVKNICQKNFVPTTRHIICSTHFTADSYINGYVSVNQLKDDAIPTVFNFSGGRRKKLKRPVKKTSDVSDNITPVSTVENIEVKPDISSVMINAPSSVQTEDNICNGMNALPIIKDEADSESEEMLFLEIESKDSEEVLKEKYKKLAVCYKKSQVMMKEYRQRCKQYEKEVSKLREIINNLKEIISVTDGNYFETLS